jgi:hypothetical protein
MKAQEQIKEQLGDFSAKYGPSAIVSATVIELNNDDTVKIELSGGGVIDDARLKSVVASGSKFLLIPKVGSTVQIGAIENSEEYVVVAVHEITAMKVIIEATTYVIDSHGFELRKQNDTLKNILINIVEACEKILVLQGNNPDYVKLSTAKTSINNLLK